MSSQHFNPHICTYVHIQTLTTTWHPHLLNELTVYVTSPYILSKKINTTIDNLKSIFFKVRPGLATDCPKHTHRSPSNGGERPSALKRHSARQTGIFCLAGIFFPSESVGSLMDRSVGSLQFLFWPFTDFSDITWPVII